MDSTGVIPLRKTGKIPFSAEPAHCHDVGIHLFANGTGDFFAETKNKGDAIVRKELHLHREGGFPLKNGKDFPSLPSISR